MTRWRHEGVDSTAAVHRLIASSPAMSLVADGVRVRPGHVANDGVAVLGLSYSHALLPLGSLIDGSGVHGGDPKGEGGLSRLRA